MTCAAGKPVSSRPGLCATSAVCPLRWLDGLGGDSGPVGGDLGHDAANLVAVKSHGHDGVRAASACLAPHPLPGLVAAVGQQFGIPGDFPADDRLKGRAEVAE